MVRETTLVIAIAIAGQVKGAASSSSAPVAASASGSTTSSSSTKAAPSPSASVIAKEDLSSWKYPPPENDPAFKIVPPASPGGVKHGILPLGECPVGLSRMGAICVIAPSQIAALAKIPIPFLTPGAFGAKPLKVTIIVESALVNSLTVNKECWDVWCNKKDAEAVSKAAAQAAMSALAVQAATAVPVVAVATILGGMAAQGMSNPDPVGYAEVRWDGDKKSEPEKLKVNQDTLTPGWNTEFNHVPLGKNTVLRLNVLDADPVGSNDPMGTVSIGAEQLAAAMKLGKTAAIKVADATNGQILFVNLLVMPENG